MGPHKPKPRIVIDLIIPSVDDGNSTTEDEGSRMTCDDASIQDGENFWLPEFQESPPGTPIPQSTDGMRDKWERKTLAVSPRETVPRFYLNVLRMASIPIKDSTCYCPVCNIVRRKTLEAERQGLDLVSRTELVEQGRNKFTIYNKAKPWIRQHVQGCTNPRPLARRMPEVVTGHTAVLNNIYRSQMLPPGKIIKDVKKISTPRDLNSRKGVPRPRTLSASAIELKFP